MKNKAFLFLPLLFSALCMAASPATYEQEAKNCVQTAYNLLSLVDPSDKDDALDVLSTSFARLDPNQAPFPVKQIEDPNIEDKAPLPPEQIENLTIEDGTPSPPEQIENSTVENKASHLIKQIENHDTKDEALLAVSIIYLENHPDHLENVLQWIDQIQNSAIKDEARLEFACTLIKKNPDDFNQSLQLINKIQDPTKKFNFLVFLSTLPSRNSENIFKLANELIQSPFISKDDKHTAIMIIAESCPDHSSDVLDLINQFFPRDPYQKILWLTDAACVMKNSENILLFIERSEQCFVHLYTSECKANALIRISYLWQKVGNMQEANALFDQALFLIKEVESYADAIFIFKDDPDRVATLLDKVSKTDIWLLTSLICSRPNIMRLGITPTCIPQLGRAIEEMPASIEKKFAFIYILPTIIMYDPVWAEKITQQIKDKNIIFQSLSDNDEAYWFKTITFDKLPQIYSTHPQEALHIWDWITCSYLDKAYLQVRAGIQLTEKNPKQAAKLLSQVQQSIDEVKDPFDKIILLCELSKGYLNLMKVL
jgi:hypothetical protein